MSDGDTNRSRSLWLDPGFGASGDMILGALIGLGVPKAEVADGIGSLTIDGWTMEQSDVRRGSLLSTRVEVKTSESHHHRTWASIDSLLAESSLPTRVVDGARATFRRLGEVEAGIHGVSINDVHFHEVGAVDAIVDIVGTWLALHSLSVNAVHCGPIGLGHGTVTAAHGPLPLPAPATASLLEGVPVRGLDAAGETITPTGAALLTTMTSHWGPLPEGVLVRTARGAGGRDPATYPNVLSAHLIEAAGAGDDDLTVTSAVLLQTNLDDVAGEIVAHTIERCLDRGADDAWAQPIVMKKSRPAVELNVLCRADLVDELRRVIFTETATLGIRTSTMTKHALPRRFETVDVDGQAVSIKVGPHGAKPEFDDLVAAAKALQTSVTDVSRRAMERLFQKDQTP